MSNRIYMATQTNGPVVQPIYTVSTKKNYELGFKLDLADGRSFRYCSNGASSLPAGVLVQSAANQFGTDDGYYNLAVASPAAVGSRTVTITNGSVAITANQFADGYLAINDSTGAGHMYKVAGNTAAAASATCTVTLADPIRVALTTSSKAMLVASPYSGVIVAPATPTGPVVGVTVVPVTASGTSTYYFWAQTRGPACVKVDSTVTIGANTALTRTLSSTYLGGVSRVIDASTGGVIEQVVGVSLDTIASTYKGRFAVVYLTID